MNANANPTRYTLAGRELLALEHSHGFVVDCLEGELWITAAGAAGDYLLLPGQRLRLAGSPRVVVSALRPAVVAARPCCGDSPIRRIAARCTAAVADAIRRWQHAPLAAYPVIRLR
ncbi:DUF2917 domain-containing protein [Azospira restricta]|uniref:DUF2917 domain-containing protein n=1 Tax=Azospira restricta TaxID=404405 RepID=A0A974PW76_9RHOO|nr:DUF2917 domain-containing protein [Azospira restricta]QRJ62623.1 DUF2917 domain-containing protein [Azospira restricta]